MDFLEFIKQKIMPWGMLTPGVTYDVLAPSSEKKIVEDEDYVNVIPPLVQEEKLLFLNEPYETHKEPIILNEPITQEKETIPSLSKKNDGDVVLSSQVRRMIRRVQRSNKSPLDTTRICLSNYGAMEIHGYFGCIDFGEGIESDLRNLVIHTPKRQDTSHMLSLQVGDTIHVVYIHGKTGGVLRIKYVTRSKYFSPGTPITSVKIGVEGWND